jgi:hypothetical protein
MMSLQRANLLFMLFLHFSSLQIHFLLMSRQHHQCSFHQLHPNFPILDLDRHSHQQQLHNLFHPIDPGSSASIMVVAYDQRDVDDIALFNSPNLLTPLNQRWFGSQPSRFFCHSEDSQSCDLTLALLITSATVTACDNGNGD